MASIAGPFKWTGEEGVAGRFDRGRTLYPRSFTAGRWRNSKRAGCTCFSSSALRGNGSISRARGCARSELRPDRHYLLKTSRTTSSGPKTLRARPSGAPSSTGVCSRRRLKIRALPARYFLKGGLCGGLKGWSHRGDKGKFAHTLSFHVIEVTEGGKIGCGIVEGSSWMRGLCDANRTQDRHAVAARRHRIALRACSC